MSLLVVDWFVKWDGDGSGSGFGNGGEKWELEWISCNFVKVSSWAMGIVQLCENIDHLCELIELLCESIEHFCKSIELGDGNHADL